MCAGVKGQGRVARRACSSLVDRRRAGSARPSSIGATRLAFHLGRAGVASSRWAAAASPVGGGSALLGADVGPGHPVLVHEPVAGVAHQAGPVPGVIGARRDQ